MIASAMDSNRPNRSNDGRAIVGGSVLLYVGPKARVCNQINKQASYHVATPWGVALSDGHSMLAGTAKSSLATRTFGKFIDNPEFGLNHRHDDQLGEALHGIQGKSGLA